MLAYALFIFSFFSQATDLYRGQIFEAITVDGGQTRFPSDYVAARAAFRAKAAEVKKKFPTSEIGFYKIPSKIDADLTTDHIFIPGSKKDRLVIITSGIHGAEAFAGHALQLLVMDRLIHAPARPYGLLVVHALNPYGFKYFRRTNENNVDLNRNFADAEEFKSTNAEYENLRHLLEPQYKASGYSLARIGFFVNTGWINLTKGKKVLLGSLRGQYQFPKGIFFGGSETQPEVSGVEALIKRHADKVHSVYHIDLHTGFGARGHLHFFGSNKMTNPTQVNAVRSVFADYKIDTGNDKDFYTTTGDFSDWLWKTYPDKKIIPMTFEFGTMDSQTLLGGLRSLWITVLENQGFQNGYLSVEDEQKARDGFEKLFNPASAEWQSAVIRAGSEAIEATLKNFENLQ